ncbi:unnamed protein product [Ilex paraguariensis]|uniref:PCI domain-containing protein n=1 Tax=Ilex paraguariensis TaxID=185542 RepID=A0ABC8QS28_9AQUA
MDIEQKQAEHIEYFVKQASAHKGSSLANIIVEATSHPSLFAFSEILAVPNVLELQGTEMSVYLDLLRMFAYGTWSEFKSNAGHLPQLVPDQLLKLKQLTVLTLAETNKVLPYDVLKQELDVTNVRELEDFLINECMYVGIVRGKLDQLRRCFEVQFAAGRDLRPGQLGSMIHTLSNCLKLSFLKGFKVWSLNNLSGILLVMFVSSSPHSRQLENGCKVLETLLLLFVELLAGEKQSVFRIGKGMCESTLVLWKDWPDGQVLSEFLVLGPSVKGLFPCAFFVVAMEEKTIVANYVGKGSAGFSIRGISHSYICHMGLALEMRARVFNAGGHKNILLPPTCRCAEEMIMSGSDINTSYFLAKWLDGEGEVGSAVNGSRMPTFGANEKSFGLATSDNLLISIQEKIKWADTMSEMDKKHQKEVEERVEEVKKSLTLKADVDFRGHEEVYSEHGGVMDYEEDRSRPKRRRHPMG